MKDIRIGNDINVRWSILSEGVPFILEGKDISVYLRTPFGKNKIEQFTILGNGIEWIFPGKQQKYLGKHSLTLVINEDADDMITTDACNFVNLVACSCDVGGTPDLNVEVETIELTSVVEFNYDDTEIRQELAKKVNKEDIPEWINDAVIISPLSDSLAIIKAFNDYNLSSKKGQVLLSFVKREDSMKSTNQQLLLWRIITQRAQVGGLLLPCLERASVLAHQTWRLSTLTMC